MTEAQTLLLGFIAGVTILLGLPAGRLRTPRPGLRQFLNALAIGILLFLIWDVLVHAYAPLDTALRRLHEGTAGIGPVFGYGALFILGISAGLLSLVYYERWLAARARPKRFGPGAMAPGELTAARAGVPGWSAGRRLSLLIAVGIGLHNFGEGLAIGQAAAANEVSLALVLIIGFALHNATEGFGIVGPTAGEVERPSWGFLGLMGLIGGGPTFVGTVIGHAWVSTALEVVFFAVAAGSILYVVAQLLEVCRRYNRPVVVAWMPLVGLGLGLATDFVLVAAGA